MRKHVSRASVLETLAQIQAGGSAADPVRGPGCPGACPEAGAGAARPNRPEDRGNPSDRATCLQKPWVPG